MVALLRFLLRYNYVFLFIILESFAIFLIVKGNEYQNASFYNFSLNLSGYVSTKNTELNQYLYLREINEQLAAENNRLKNDLSAVSLMKGIGQDKIKVDTSWKANEFIVAKVVNNTTSKQYNYITLNQGSEDGIKVEMPVISKDGVVGIVYQTSEHFSLVMSVLNRKLKVSCKFKKNNYFGSFEWSGINYRTGSLNNIPLHLDVKVGDTLVSTGYSVFPENVLVGFVSKVEKTESNFYTIELTLSNDFRELYYVYIVKDPLRAEKEVLEKQTE